MKHLVLLLITLIGCSANNEPNPEPKPVVVPQRPAPIEDSGTETTITCIIVRSAWGGNCVVNLINCSDGTSRLDSKCYPPDWVPPWKNAPDPPY